MKGGADTLWDIAIELQRKSDNRSLVEEKHVIICGSRNAGKTSLILRFLDRDEAPKPTTALEYTFGRRSKGNSTAKDVGHIWELAGGASLAKLLENPVNADSILNTSIVLVVDLSQPNDMWVTMESLLSALSSRVEVSISAAARKDPSVLEKIKAATKERNGADHMDADLLEPFKIPLVIVGTKYDLYQELDPEKKKIISKSLRFLAHTYGASLYFCSVKLEPTLNKVRSVLGSLVFGMQMARVLQIDNTKPLMIPAGMDSFQQIGSPPISERDLGSVSARNPVELWKQAFVTVFPQNSIRGAGHIEETGKNIQFSEPVIDKLRLEKDEELERYKKASEKRMKELEMQALQDGLI